ncbi:MAG: hypothetical protein V4538_05620 [Bacteroidota bacterium]
MEINKDNYEAILIDYLDGNLNKQEEAMLLLFLENNPAINEEFSLLKEANLSIPEEPLFSFNKETLKKPTQIKVNEYHNAIISHIEGNLTQKEELQLLHDIEAYPELKKEYNLFTKTKLDLADKLIFQDKESLKKKSARIIPLYFKVASMAAIFIAIFFLFVTNSNTKEDNALATNEEELAKVNKKEDSIKNVINRKSDVEKQLIYEQDKQMVAFGGINPAAAQKSTKKAPAVNTINPKQPTNTKKSTKENPLNNNNTNQSVQPIKPVKIIAENNIADINKIIPNQSMVNTAIDTNKIMIAENNNQFLANNSVPVRKQVDISAYIKEQMRYTAQSEVIPVNKPENVQENISFIESVGLNMLALYNKVAKKEVKVKKTYNEDGEVEKVRLVANGW